MSAQWTPGPWLIKEYPQVGFGALLRNRVIHDDTGRIIGYTRTGPDFAEGEAEANARLVAAAPVMAKALRYTLDSIDSGESALDIQKLRGIVSEALALALLSPYLEDVNA